MSQENDPKPLLFDGFEKAYIGMLRRYGHSAPVALYDYNKCMNILMERDGMEEDEAVEWIEVNMLGGYLGESTPGMVFRCTLNEMAEECNIPLPEQDDDRDYGDEHDEDLTTEQKEAIENALHKFAHHFVNYVRDVDPKLFLRAKQYAADYSGTDMVEFVVDDEDETPKEKEKE
jgi:hypothetical protein